MVREQGGGRNRWNCDRASVGGDVRERSDMNKEGERKGGSGRESKCRERGRLGEGAEVERVR